MSRKVSTQLWPLGIVFMRRIGGSIGLAVVVGGLMFVPMLLPYLMALIDPNALAVWREGSRIAELIGHTAALLAITLLLVIPLGITTAHLLQSATPRARHFARLLFVVSLATPLVVTTVAWHLVRLGQWSPFARGLFPAAILHALAGLPWVVLIVESGLSSRDPAVNDDARLQAGPMVRTLRVTLPSVRAFIVLAGIWVAAQTASEIVITDMLQVRTFAEEVYTQAVAPSTETADAAESAVARAVSATLPVPLVFGALLLVNLKQVRGQPAQFLRPNDHRESNRLAGFLAIVIALATIGVPTVNLFMRCAATVGGHSAVSCLKVIGTAASENSWLLINSSVAAAATGFGLSFVAGVVASRSVHHPILRALLFTSAALAVATPGPVIGLGVRSAIDFLLSCEEKFGVNWLRGPLYDGPALIPAAWSWLIRGWPLALAVWWPEVARLPRQFGETTRLETDSFWLFLRHESWPALRRPFVVAAGLVAIYCLGEVSASHLVATPGGQSFAHDVFARMHYGITPELAGMCLVLLLLVVAVVVTLHFLMLRLEAR
jgi:iron(III) transport system permease protein